MSEVSTTNLKQAERGAIVSIVAYIVVSLAKVVIGHLFLSAALVADGLNNVTDVISSVLVLVGLRISQKPVDANHPYGHWKFEQVASLATSFIMFFIGIEVLRSSVTNILEGRMPTPSWITAITAALAGVVMSCVYIYNNRLATRLHSLGLKAAAKDNLSDALTSFATAIAIFAASLGLGWLDAVMAIVVGLIILKTAFDIFKESTFALTDGFDQKELEDYRPLIMAHEEVKEIGEIKARRYGSNVYMDLTVLMDPNLTVLKSHAVTEEIETELRNAFSIPFIDIHVEPFLEEKTP